MKEKKVKRLSTKKKIIIGITSFLVLILISGISYGYYMASKVNRVEVDRSELVDTGLEGPTIADNTISIALFGTDYGGVDMGSGVGAADSTMLLTIDPDNNKIKLCSLMRDTYMNVPDGYKMNLNYTLATGGYSLIMRTINYNFDLKIDKFVRVDLVHLPKVIDKLGGVELTITNDELQYINGYISDIDKENGTKTNKITKTGKQLLNGTQASAYCRIRYTSGNDYKRTERQRDVLEALFVKMKNVSITEVPGIVSDLLPLVTTNMTNTEIFSIASTVLGMNVLEIEQGRFPLDGDHKSEWTDMYHIIADMDKTKKEIHKFLYNKE